MFRASPHTIAAVPGVSSGDYMDIPQPVQTSADPLFDLEHGIARRADELSRNRDPNGRYPLLSWLDAESEILPEALLRPDTLRP